MKSYSTEICITCGGETVSVVKTDDGYVCYNCYAEKRNPTKKKLICKLNSLIKFSISVMHLIAIFPNKIRNTG